MEQRIRRSQKDYSLAFKLSVAGCIAGGMLSERFGSARVA